MMTQFERVVRFLTGYCDRVAQVGVMAMMLLTVINIIFRLVWRSVAGTYDYIEFIGATVVAFSIAYCALNKGHIEVEILMARLPGRVQGVIGSITGILSLGIFSLITWQSLLLAGDMLRHGETSMTALLPFYPFIYGIAFGTALLCMIILVGLVKSMARAVKG